jgi:hypothetical protein
MRFQRDTMRFPETTREGSAGHRDALGRLDAAVADQRSKRELHQAVTGTVDERRAADDLAASNEQVAAREAWVSWVERGY